MPSFETCLPVLIATALASAAQAQTAPVPNSVANPTAENAAADSEEPVEEIIVSGQRAPGSVASDIKPEAQFSAGEVRAFGVSSVSELLGELTMQTGSSRGRGGDAPVTLLNGQRISGFNEIRDLPTEAIARVEIFPEELALKYGYRADQKVVNIVLRRRFRATTVELAPMMATRGGAARGKAEVGHLRITSAARTTFNAQYQHDSPLYESERNILTEIVPGGLDQRPYRTLVATSHQAALNGTVHRTIGTGITATLNGRFEATANESGLGATLLPGALQPAALLRESDGISAHAGLAFSGAFHAWKWNFISNYDFNRMVTLTDRAESVRDRARTTTHTSTSELVVSGSPFRLPAGDASATFNTEFDATGLSGSSIRSGVSDARSLSRRIASVQGSFDFPIASSKNEVLQPIGKLSLNLNGSVRQVSDFGTLKTYGAGLTWSPVSQIEFLASMTDEDGAPTMQQLGNPLTVTPNIQVYDFRQGATARISRIDGGTPSLIADKRRVIKFGATIKPLAGVDFSLSANYTSNRTSNLIATFPSATLPLEDAFPERFVRDFNGNLLSIDSRPVNFARAERRQLRWGFNFSKRLGPAQVPGGPDSGRPQGRGRSGAESAAAQGDRPRSQFGGEGGGRNFGAARAPRLQVSVYHGLYLKNDILIREGVPLLDLLNGNAVDSGGGQPRHEIELQAGYTQNGLGLRLNGNWKSGTRVRGAPAIGGGTTGDLFFSGYGKFGLRLFADLGLQQSMVKSHPWVRGMRLSVSVDNLFDSHPTVRDANNVIPNRFQGDYLDPLGRTIRISLRKIFF